MGRILFWFGVAFFWLATISKQFFGAELTPAMMTEGYGYAIGIMVMGMGMQAKGGGNG